MALVGKIFKEEKDILYRRGEIKGEIKGIEKGRYEEALEIALELKKEGLATEFIAKITKLSIEEIQAL